MRLRRVVPLVLACLVALVAGCGGPAPSTPPAMAAAVAGWARIGLACVGPSPSDQVDGLLKWTCTGKLHATDVSAALDGDARGLFLASISVPTSTEQATIVAIFADVADATTAYASVGPQIHAWIEAWGGTVDGATFGPASLAIATAVGSPPTTSLYMTGPRKNVDDPIP